ncbi:MAG: hypothetical protein L0Z73_01490 [Gammaproteobacteria bacterium]|nr:hypothetical protein [Gammaproteobacteria bacterium]
MKKIIVVILLVQSCAVVAGTAAPTGEQVLDALFNNTTLNLNQEPDCKQFSATRNTDQVTLGQHLATILSVSYQSKNKVTLATNCTVSKYQVNKGKVIDVWDCALEMKETNPAGEFISSAMVGFYLTKDKFSLIKGGIRCF